MSNTSLTKSRKSSTLQVLPALPYMLWLVVFIAVPLGLVLFFALTDSSGSFTLDKIFPQTKAAHIIAKKRSNPIIIANSPAFLLLHPALALYCKAFQKSRQ